MRYIVCLFVLFFALPLCSQPNLSSAITEFAGLKMFDHAQVGVCVIDVETGKKLAGFGEEKSLIPASSLKVLTTAAALKILGPDYRFRTELQYDGSIDEQGVLRGNLYIKGYGDPTLATNDLQQTASLEEVIESWITAVQQTGIKRIDGYIIGDASFFETAVNGRTWPWEDLGNYYAAGVWGLNIHDNLYYLSLQQQAKLGARPTITRMDPPVPGLLLINELRSAARGTGDQAYIFGAPFNYTRFIRGTLPIGKGEMTIKGGIPDPPAFAAQLLAQSLNNTGIHTAKAAVSLLELQQFSGNNSLARTKTRTTIHTLQSPPISEVIKVANQQSINLYCEALLKIMGWQERQEASTEAGIATLLAFWQQKGLSLEGLFLEDGSGLSPRNGISAHQLARLLTIIAKDKAWYPLFAPTLPLAGSSGTLRGLFNGSKVAGKLRAKSGGMARVRSYTGYVPGPDGRLRAFCLIANNFTVKSTMVRNEMIKLMIRFSQLN